MKKLHQFKLYDNDTGKMLASMECTMAYADEFARRWCKNSHKDVMLACYNPFRYRWEQLSVFFWIKEKQEVLKTNDWVAPMNITKFH